LGGSEDVLGTFRARAVGGTPGALHALHPAGRAEVFLHSLPDVRGAPRVGEPGDLTGRAVGTHQQLALDHDAETDVDSDLQVHRVVPVDGAAGVVLGQGGAVDVVG